MWQVTDPDDYLTMELTQVSLAWKNGERGFGCFPMLYSHTVNAISGTIEMYRMFGHTGVPHFPTPTV